MVSKTCIICNSSDLYPEKTTTEDGFNLSQNDIHTAPNQHIYINTTTSYESKETCTENHETKLGLDENGLTKKRGFCECFELSPAEYDSIFKNSQELEFQLDLCTTCKDLTVKLTSQLAQLRQIQLDISAMKAGLCLKVISCIESKTINTTTASPEVTNQDSHLTTNFRQFIYNRYSPQISCERIKELKKSQHHSENDIELSFSPHSVDIDIDNVDEERDSEETYDSDYSDQRQEEEEDDHDSDPEFLNDNKDKRRRKTLVERISTKLKERNKEQESKRAKDRIRIRKRKRRLKSPSSRQHTFEISPGIFQFHKWTFEVNTESSEFKCFTCEFITSSRSKMLQHINALHNTERFPCSTCKRSWKSQSRLDSHECAPKVARRKVKTQELPNGKIVFNGTWEYEKVNDLIGYKCGICGALKKTKMIMNRHILERHAQPHRFMCELCGRGFGNKRGFNTHQETHANDPTTLYQCEECGGIFPTQGRLYFHLQSHVQWSCGHCQKTFKYKNGLVRHQKQAGHPETFVKSTRSSARISGEEDVAAEILKCPRCQKIYQTKETLTVHLTKCRGNSKLTCEECGAVLSNIFIFRRHVRRHKEKQAREQQQQQNQSNDSNNERERTRENEKTMSQEYKEEGQSLKLSNNMIFI